MNKLVNIKDGQPVASSRDIANHFEKEHKNVLDSIEKLVKGVAEKSAGLFLKSKYQHSQNKQWFTEYLMTRDGFSLLVMGFTGSKALDWKLKYIEAFNKMEQELTFKNKLPKDFPSALRMLADSEEEKFVLIEENQKKEKLLTEQKPKVEFANQVSDAVNAIDIAAMAKIVHDKKIPIGRNKLFEWMRISKILQENNLPYQSFIDNGLLKVKEVPRQTRAESKFSPKFT